MDWPSILVDSAIGALLHVNGQHGMTREPLLQEQDMRPGVNLKIMQLDNGHIPYSFKSQRSTDKAVCEKQKINTFSGRVGTESLETGLLGLLHFMFVVSKVVQWESVIPEL